MDRYSPTPLYQQLSDVLAEEIGKGTFKPNEQLPSETELILAFEVSRHVVRQALNNLAHEGKIYTEHGRGSYVARERIEKPLGVLQSYHDSMRKSGLEPEVRVLRKEIIPAPAEVAEAMGIEPGRQMFHLQRAGYLDGNPINLLDAYILPGKCSPEQLMAYESGSLYAHLERTCSVNFVRCRFSIEVIFSGDYESRFLAVPRGSALMKTVSVSRDKNNTPIEYSSMLHPATFFRFYFESVIGDQKNGNCVQN